MCDVVARKYLKVFWALGNETDMVWWHGMSSEQDFDTWLFSYINARIFFLCDYAQVVCTLNQYTVRCDILLMLVMQV